MLAPLAKSLDWINIQKHFLRWPSVQGRDMRLKEAIQLATGPDFIPAHAPPASVEFNPDNPEEFHFPTPRPSGFVENDVAIGRLYRCAGRWQERPTIVLLHEGNGFKNYHYRFPQIGRLCNQAGVNVATLVSPYDLHRCPRQPFGRDYFQLMSKLAQGVAEIRALLGWLLSECCPGVALWGFSMGGWLGGLAACHEPRLTCAILAVSRTRTNCFPTQRIIWARVRKTLRQQQSLFQELDAAPTNLALLRPAIPRENILLIEAVHDIMAPVEHIEELWRIWKQPEIWRLPHGHTSCCTAAPSLTRDVLGWLSSSALFRFAAPRPFPSH